MSTPLKVFVASPFPRRFEVRRLHETLRLHGIDPVARWPYLDREEAETSPIVLRADAARNDRDRTTAHCLLVVGHEGEGGEMWGETTASLLQLRMPVCWVGRRTLSAYRDGVHIAESLEDALDVLQRWAGLIARPYEAEPSWGRSVIWDEVIEHQRAWLASQEVATG